MTTEQSGHDRVRAIEPSTARGRRGADPVSLEDRTAPRWRRLVARTVDDLVLYVAAEMAIVGIGLESFTQSDTIEMGLVLSNLPIAIGMFLLLAILPVVWWGGRPAQLLLGLRVVLDDESGRLHNVGYGRALARSWTIAVWVPMGLFLYALAALVSLVPVLRPGRRRALWDRVAGTTVVRAP